MDLTEEEQTYIWEALVFYKKELEKTQNRLSELSIPFDPKLHKRVCKIETLSYQIFKNLKEG